MATPEELLTQAANEAVAATKIATEWANKPEGWYSATDSGPLPSIKEFLKLKSIDVDNAVAKVGFFVAGEFGTAFTIENRNEVGFDEATKSTWRWNGVLPHSVLAGDAPSRPNWSIVAGGGLSLAGTFAAGGTITSNQQLVEDSDGNKWRWTGTLNYTFSAGENPNSVAGWELFSDSSLRSDLANSDYGAAMVARGVVAVDSIADLLELPEGQRKEGLRYLVKGYHAGSDIGGGEFYWESGKAKSDHNGVAVLSNTVPAPVDQPGSTLPQQADSFNRGDGETDPSGSGCYIRIKQFGPIYTARNAGCVNNLDCTQNLQWLVDITPVGESAWLEPQDWFLFSGLDLSSGTRASLVSNSNLLHYELPVLQTVGSATLFNSHGKSVALFLNDDPDVIARGRRVEGIRLVEGAAGTRDYGVYGRNVPWLMLDYIQTQGFERGICVHDMWDARIDNLDIQGYRNCGFALYDLDDTEAAGEPSGIANNGVHIGSIRTSTIQASRVPRNLAIAGNSVVIENLVTEGFKDAHILVTQNLVSLAINQIHAEGSSHFIQFDGGHGTPTIPYGVITINAGEIQQVGDGFKFVDVTSGPVGAGLSGLNLGGVTLRKSASTDLPYFDLSGLANFNTVATLEHYSADSTINSYTWHKVGKKFSDLNQTSQMGHDGLVRSTNGRMYYTGLTDEYVRRIRLPGDSMATPSGAVLIAADVDRLFQYIIDVRVDTGNANEANHARFLLTQSKNNVNSEFTLIASTGLYASDTSFAVYGGSRVIQVFNPLGGGGYFYFRIHRMADW